MGEERMDYGITIGITHNKQMWNAPVVTYCTSLSPCTKDNQFITGRNDQLNAAEYLMLCLTTQSIGRLDVSHIRRWISSKIWGFFFTKSHTQTEIWCEFMILAKFAESRSHEQISCSRRICFEICPLSTLGVIHTHVSLSINCFPPPPHPQSLFL